MYNEKMIKKEVITKSPRDTKKIGQSLGEIAARSKKLFLVCLNGDLGGGKTTFVQGFAKGLEVKEDITSPTFIVFKKYLGKNGKKFYHFDAYRINTDDLAVLGFKEILSDENNIVLIEWADNIKESLVKKTIEINFIFQKEKERKLIIKGDDDIIEN